LKLHILPLMGAMRIHLIDADDVQRLIKRLSDRGSSPTTLSQYLVIVRKLLKLAFSRKWIRELPELPKINIDSRAPGGFHPAPVQSRVAQRQTAFAQRG